jgi:uncharacterized protein YndB with AHSA1/START domain
VLAYRRPEFLVFSWNAPPEIPSLRSKKAKTRVEIRLEPAGDKTDVSMTQSGWSKGADWDETFRYFDEAWDVVLSRLKSRFETGRPFDWSSR